jgi:hypothetical protein
MFRHIDFTKTTKGIPKKGEETAEDIKYWKAIIKARDQHSKKIESQGYWERMYDLDGAAISEELYAIPGWWFEENDK